MALLIPSPAQGEAFRQWVLDALNRDDAGEPIDPPAFADRAVILGNRDHPTLARYCLVQGVALTGQPLLLEYAATDLGEPEQALIETRRRTREWSVLVTVCTKPDRSSTAAAQVADVASEHLTRVIGAFDGVALVGMAAVGLAPLRIGDVTDDSRLRGSSEWESRASVVLTLASGWYATRSVDWVEQATGTGTAGGQGPLGFDSDQGA